MTKVILACSFHQHVVDAKGTYRMLADLYTLKTAQKQVRVKRCRISLKDCLRYDAGKFITMKPFSR